MEVKAKIFVAAVAFAAACCGAESEIETPTMGWSSWNTYKINISETLIRRQADLIKELGLDKCGYIYVNVDDGWFGGRDADGRLLTHPERFPNGLKDMADYIHSLGLKAGIYSDGGENTCGSRYDGDTWGIGVGFWNHDDQDAQFLFGDNPFDFIKIDFCGGESAGNHLKINMDERERYTAIRRAIDKVRPGVRINVCRWDYPGTWVRSVGSSWRISHDITPQWKRVRDIIRQNLYLGAYAAPGAYNDMDMLEVGRGMSAIEDATHFVVWCFMSSPLLIGCDLQRLKDKPNLRLLLTDKKIIALNQDTAEVQGRVVKRDGEFYALVRDVEKPFGTKRAVLFVNLEDSPKTMRLEPHEIDLAYDDHQEHASLSAQKTPDHAIEAELPAHGACVFIREADRRLERTVYEAETGFMPTYQELKDPVKAKTAYYKEDPAASGGVYAAGLGGRPGNDLVFERVWSEKGGDYRIAVDTFGDEGVMPQIVVNGVEAESSRITLRPGVNEIRLVSPSAQMRPIDKIAIFKL